MLLNFPPYHRLEPLLLIEAALDLLPDPLPVPGTHSNVPIFPYKWPLGVLDRIIRTTSHQNLPQATPKSIPSYTQRCPDTSSILLLIPFERKLQKHSRS